MSESAILDLRLRDLDASIDRSPLAKRIETVMSELAGHGLKLRPHCHRLDARGRAAAC